jgi:hypothetical protein
MTKHPLTIEKECLKEIAAKIVDLKLSLAGPHTNVVPHYIDRQYTDELSPMYLVYLADMQSRLAELKKQYRNRHYAYCMVRQSISSRFNQEEKSCAGSVFRKGPIMTTTKLDMDVVNMHRVKLLTAITRVQSDRIDDLKDEVNEYKPCIALFKPVTGKEKKLYIKDFHRTPKGDFIWECKRDGIVFNQLSEWKAEAGDTVNLTKDEYDNMPTDLKMPPGKDPSDPVHQDSKNDQWYFWDEVWADRYGPYITEATARAVFKDYCQTYLDYKKVWIPPSKKIDLPSKEECYEMVRKYLRNSLNTLDIHEPPEPQNAWILKNCWGCLPTNKRVHKWPNEMYEICGQNFHNSVDIKYIIDWLSTRITKWPI